MILLGKYGNIELAIKPLDEKVDGCAYDFRKMKQGMILTLTGKKPSKVGFPVPYSGIFEKQFDKLKRFDFEAYDEKRNKKNEDGRFQNSIRFGHY